MKSLSEIVNSTFFEHYHYQATNFFSAPGRVNLIGDHTDYNDGYVLPAAINFGTTIAAAPRGDKLVRIIASDFNEDYALLRLDELAYDPERSWINYIAGTLSATQEMFGQIKGMDLVISGNVPIGAGLSSSASLETALLNMVRHFNGLKFSGIEAAVIGQKAENNFAGCNCGIMDQVISALGKEDHAMLLDCRNLTYRDAKLPSNLNILIINSNVRRGLVDSAYNERRKQCEDAAAALDKQALRDVSIRELVDKKDLLTSSQYKRAKHVVSENLRTISAFEALQKGDVEKLSYLMKESHISLRDDFEVTTKELDSLVEMTSDIIGNKGGVRMTGGGFGGCVVALTPESLINDIKETIKYDYPALFGLDADIYSCKATRGPFREY